MWSLYCMRYDHARQDAPSFTLQFYQTTVRTILTVIIIAHDYSAFGASVEMQWFLLMCQMSVLKTDCRNVQEDGIGEMMWAA